MKRKVAVWGRLKRVIFVEYVRSTGRKVFTVAFFRCNTELRWDLIFRNLSEPKKTAAGKSRIFQGNQETHGAVLW